METVLITGGSGFIGSNLCWSFLTRYRVVVVDREIRKAQIPAGVITERADLSHYASVQEVINKYQPEYIVHLAAMPLASAQNICISEAFEGCVNITTSLLECVSRSNYEFKRFVYASSSMVYGHWTREQMRETDDCKPISEYGVAKLCGEEVTKRLCEMYGYEWACVRPSAVFGRWDKNRRVSQLIVESALNHEIFCVHGADEQLDFTPVRDVCQGFYLATTQRGGANETFNITWGKAHTILEFCHAVKREAPHFSWTVVERDQHRPKRGTLDISKARALLGYVPSERWDQSCTEYFRAVSSTS